MAGGRGNLLSVKAEGAVFQSCSDPTRENIFTLFIGNNSDNETASKSVT